MKKITLHILLVMMILSACDTTDEISPAFLYIDNISIDVQGDEGSASDNIKTIWLFVNGQSLGVYEPNIRIPVLETGEVDLVFQAGVARSGISSQQTIYPFYQQDNYTITLNSLETHTLNLQFTYEEEIDFKFINDFEVGNNFQNLVENEGADIRVISSAGQVFEGSRSGAVFLNSTETAFLIGTINEYEFPFGRPAVYLELNYRCSHTFDVFLQSTDPTNIQLPVNTLLVSVVSKEDWNKIYVDVSNAVAQANTQGFTLHKILFASGLPEGDAEGSFFFDNIKLISSR